jgi:hypothetical protein
MPLIVDRGQSRTNLRQRLRQTSLQLRGRPQTRLILAARRAEKAAVLAVRPTRESNGARDSRTTRTTEAERPVSTEEDPRIAMTRRRRIRTRPETTTAIDRNDRAMPSRRHIFQIRRPDWAITQCQRRASQRTRAMHRCRFAAHESTPEARFGAGVLNSDRDSSCGFRDRLIDIGVGSPRRVRWRVDERFGQPPVRGFWANSSHVRRVGSGQPPVSVGSDIVPRINSDRSDEIPTHVTPPAPLLGRRVWVQCAGRPAQRNVRPLDIDEHSHRRLKMTRHLMTSRSSAHHRARVIRFRGDTSKRYPWKKAWTPEFHTRRPQPRSSTFLRSSHKSRARRGVNSGPSTSLFISRDSCTGSSLAPACATLPRSTRFRFGTSR